MLVLFCSYINYNVIQSFKIINTLRLKTESNINFNAIVLFNLMLC